MRAQTTDSPFCLFSPPLLLLAFLPLIFASLYTQGEQSFCGAIEQAGKVTMKCSVVKGGIELFALKQPVFLVRRLPSLSSLGPF